jgi:biofilm PGA synthesis N-glycosyltransferase PgaC
MCAYNEENNIEKSIKSICSQKYYGDIYLIVVDNCSVDKTRSIIYKAIRNIYYCKIQYMLCRKKGKSYALNCGLKSVRTKYFITVDADTILENDAVQKIMNHIVNERSSCVAGNLFVQNSHASLLTKMQIYDYLLSIAAVKRFQGSYHSTLVAQGAFSAYLTRHVKALGGWKNVVGEDILLTYQLLKLGYKSTYEPHAVGYTCVPQSFSAFYNQRKRWAIGMLEGFKEVKPWQLKTVFSKFFSLVNIMIIYLDLAFVFGFLVGVILAFMGYFYFVGYLTLLTLIISLINFSFMYIYQKKLGIPFKDSLTGFLLFSLFYQTIQSLAALNGYFDKIFRRKVAW